jgi:hypothetical protein
MGRFLLVLVVGLAIFGGIVWYNNRFGEPSDKLEVVDQSPTPSDGAGTPADLGPNLYTGPAVPVDPDVARAAFADPVVLPNYHVVSIDVINVPARYDGKLLFVGTQIPKNEARPGLDLFAPIFYGKNKQEFIFYKPLQEGEVVKEDQMLALVDPTLARNQLEIKNAKWSAAIAEHGGAKAVRDVYKAEYQRVLELRDKHAASASEVEVAKAQYLRSLADAKSKEEAITVAKKEAIEAETIDMLHEIRSPFPKQNNPKAKPRRIQIKTIFRHGGEAVKTLEPVLQVIDLARLRAEGMVQDRLLGSVHTGMKVIVEAIQRRKPIRAFRGHRGEVYAVAVSQGGKYPLLVSGGADETVRVWNRRLVGEYLILPHYSAVHAIACSPRKAKGINYCLTGCEDGSVRVWDLDKDYSKEPDPRPLWEAKRQHKDTVQCVAISPDGKWYASGGEDSDIILGDLKTGKIQYTFDARKGHQGAVTSLHFTPDLKLVSAGRDNTIRVWSLYQKGAWTDPRKALPNRGGSVTSLGVSPNGKWLLFDQGKTIKVLSLSRGRTVGEIKDPGQGTPFETLALFSPDSELILTANSAENGLQLWKAPTDGERAYEVRRFVAEGGVRVSCAAFGEAAGLKDTGEPDADRVFAVTGTKDGQVFLWAVPNMEEVNRRVKGTVSLVERVIDPGTHQARIWVDIDNTDGTLKPGDTVTVVVPPLGKKGK